MLLTSLEVNITRGTDPADIIRTGNGKKQLLSNIALDFGFLENRISGTIDFYYKETKDLLNKVPQPAGTNFSAFIVANVGEMGNKGVEFSLNTNQCANDFTWNVDFNILTIKIK